MKSPTLCAALLLLCRLTNTCAQASVAVESETLPFEIVKKLVLVQAKIEGTIGYFILDTGASHLTLNQKYFSNKRINKDAGSSNTILGQASLQTIKIEQFQWGKVNREKLICPIADLSNLEKWLGSPLLGLIGYDILQDYEVQIDYVNHQITLLDKTDTEANWEVPPTHSLHFNLCGHLPVIEVMMGKEKVYLGLDSGATQHVLDKSWRKKVAAKATQQNKVRFTGASAGIQEADYFLLDEITLDKQWIINDAGLILTDFKMPAGRCFRLDGLLSADVLDCNQVVIDYRYAVVHIWQEKTSIQYMVY